MSSLQITIRQQQQKMFVSLRGSLSLAGNAEFYRAFPKMLSDDVTDVEIDMAAVPSIDSLGVGLLVTLYKNLTKKNSHLALVGLSTEQCEFFANLGLPSCFGLHARTPPSSATSAGLGSEPATP
jgi:anti-anti-sigma factor